MIFRWVFIVFLIIFCSSCYSENRSDDKKLIDSYLEVEVNYFSEAIATGEVLKFVKIASPQGIYLVRKFNSGNLGGRGDELSRKVSASLINNKMEFVITDQTPFNLKILFPGLSDEKKDKLPHYQLPAEIQELPFDQWGVLLVTTLAAVPEAINGDPIVLEAGSNYRVYAEAQVIEGVLMGGFAIFKNNEKEFLLVSIIEFL